MGQVVVIWIIMRNFQRKRAVKGPPGENGKSALGGSELHITRVKWSEVKWKSLSLCVLMDYIVHALLQARILGWVAFPFSRGSSQPRDRTQVSYTESSFFTNWATRAGNSLDGRQHSLYRVLLFLCWVHPGCQLSLCAPFQKHIFKALNYIILQRKQVYRSIIIKSVYTNISEV